MKKIGVFVLSVFSVCLVSAEPTSIVVAAGVVETNATAITTTEGVIKTGLGRLVLTGINTNTLEGGFTINEGAVDAQSVNALGKNSTAGVTVAAGAVLNLNAAGIHTGLTNSLAGAGVVNVLLGTGAGANEINGSLTGFTGTFNVGNGTGGKLSIKSSTGAGSKFVLFPNAALSINYNGTLTFPSDMTLKGGTTGENFGQLRFNNLGDWTGNITLDGEVQTASALIGLYNGQNARSVVSGIINEANGPRNLTVNGRDTIALTGPNTYTGGTYLRSNVTTAAYHTTLELGHPQALGINNADKPVIVETNTRLLLNNVTFSGRTLTLNGQGNVYASALAATNGVGCWAGPVILNTSDVRIGVPMGDAVLNMTGIISSAAGTSGLIINSCAAGVVRFSETNTYAGPTTLSGGKLQLGIENAFSGALFFAGGIGASPTLDLNGFNPSFPQLMGSTLDSLVNTSETPSTLTINGPFMFEGFVQGKINIVKRGDGEIRLTNPRNTFTGTIDSESGDIRVLSYGAVTVTASGVGAVVEVTQKQFPVSPGTATSTADSLGVVINGTDTFPTFTNDTATFGGILAENSTNGFYSGNDTIDTAFNAYEGTGLGQNGKWFLGSTANGVVTGSLSAASDNTYRLGGGGGTISINTSNALHDTFITNWTDETQTVIASIVTNSAAVVIGSTATNGQGVVVYNNVLQNHTGGTTVNAGSVLQYYSSVAGNATVYIPTNFYYGAGTILLNLQCPGAAANFTMNGDFRSFNGVMEISGLGGHKLNINLVGNTLQLGSSMLIRILPGGQLYTGGGKTISNNLELLGIGNTENRGTIRWGSTILAGNIGLNGHVTFGSEAANNTCKGTISNNVPIPSTLTIGTANLTQSSLYHGMISDGKAPLSITLANGTASFYATNTFTGTLLVSSGLQLAGGGTFGAGPVVNNGTLTLNNTVDLAFTNAISGTGPIVKSGTATTTLCGTNFTCTGTIAVNAGKLFFWVPTDETVTLTNTITGVGTIGVTGGGTLNLPKKAIITLIEGTVIAPFSPVNIVGTAETFDDASNLVVTSTDTYLGGIGTRYVPTTYPFFTNNTATYGGVLLQNFSGNFFADQALTDSTFNGYPGTGNGLNGYWFLGSSTAGTNTSLMAPCADGNYRLGGGGGTLYINGANNLTGARNVIIGSNSTNGQGTIVYNNVLQNYTGANIINAGSTLEFYCNLTTLTTPNNVFTGNGRLRLTLTNSAASNCYLQGDFREFTGMIDIAGAANGQKVNTGIAGLNLGSNALIRVNSGGQLFLNGTSVPALYCNLEIAGTGNNETRGAVRWQNPIYGNIGINATAYMGPELANVSLYGNVSNNTTTAGHVFCIGYTSAKTDSQLYGMISDGRASLAFQQAYGGTCTLWATNTYNGRTYVGTGSNLRIAGTGSIGPGLLELAATTAQFIADIDEDRTMTNKLTNGGKFTKRNSKDLMLTGDLSSFYGSWNVEGGRLIIDVSSNKIVWICYPVTCSNGGQFIVRGDGQVILGNTLQGDVGSIILENGAELILNGVTRSLPNVITSGGAITDGVLLLSGTIYPGGVNTVGTLATERMSILPSTTAVLDLTDSSSDAIAVSGTENIDLSNLTLDANVLSGLPESIVVMINNGGFTGKPKIIGNYMAEISLDRKTVTLRRLGTILLFR